MTRHYATDTTAKHSNGDATSGPRNGPSAKMPLLKEVIRENKLPEDRVQYYRWMYPHHFRRIGKKWHVSHLLSEYIRLQCMMYRVHDMLVGNEESKEEGGRL